MKPTVLILLVVVIMLSACGLVSSEPEMSPQEVVTKFYRWYIGYPGNPLVDREYRESAYLAEVFIQEVDDALDGQIMADPILLAQDIPERFSVDEAGISGDRASVIISLYWVGNPTPTKRKVDLRLIDREWRITDVSMIEP
jgi:hypothetical protein